MSFFKNLFGGGSEPAEAKPAAEESYNGFTIAATPMEEGGQFRLSALITKDVDGELKEHRLIRADLFASKGDAARFAIDKAKQVIDEQGDRLFS